VPKVVVDIEEKRNSPRFAWAVEIVGLILSPLAGPEQPQLVLRGVAVDISSGGIGLFTDHLISPDAVVRCEITLSDNRMLIPTLLKVRWYDKVEGEYRFGLQFLI
jgi:c-di-GMP-binding flagellar brake protein YcgR